MSPGDLSVSPTKREKGRWVHTFSRLQIHTLQVRLFIIFWANCSRLFSLKSIAKTVRMYDDWCPISDVQCLMSDVSWLISDIWCPMSHFRCPMFDVTFPMSDVRCLMSSVWCLMTGTQYVVFDVRCLMFDFCCLMSDVRCLMTDMTRTSEMRHRWHQTSDIEHRTSNIKHPTSDIGHQTLDIRINGRCREVAVSGGSTVGRKRLCWVLIIVSLELVCGMTALWRSEMCNLTILMSSVISLVLVCSSRHM